MRNRRLRVAEKRKRAVVDTVRSILDEKGYSVATVSPVTTVYDAIAEMARLGVGALPVLEDRQLVGIVSERDYARKVILCGRSSRETVVGDIMTSSVITVSLDQTVDDCLRIVTESRIRHLPVLDGTELKGIISIGDLVKAIISAQSFTIDQLHTYIATGYPS